MAPLPFRAARQLLVHTHHGAAWQVSHPGRVFHASSGFTAQTKTSAVDFTVSKNPFLCLEQRQSFTSAELFFSPDFFRPPCPRS